MDLESCFKRSLVSPLCVYKISQHFRFFKTQCCINSPYCICAKNRFPRSANRPCWHFPSAVLGWICWAVYGLPSFFDRKIPRPLTGPESSVPIGARRHTGIERIGNGSKIKKPRHPCGSGVEWAHWCAPPYRYRTNRQRVLPAKWPLTEVSCNHSVKGHFSEFLVSNIIG